MSKTKKSPRRSPKSRKTSRKLSTRQRMNRMTDSQIREAKQIALRAANELPLYVKDMKVSSGVMSCKLGANGMVCNRSLGYEVDCHRVSENKVICYINGVKFICEREKSNSPMKCRVSRS